MIRTSKRLLSFALLLCLFAALAAPALADGPFAADQQYKKDEELTAVYAVKVERGTEEKTAALRDLLLEAGFDAYLYQDYSFSVLCGKFRDREEAVAYRDALRETEYGEKAVVVRVYLDEEAIDAFEEAYASGTIAAVIEDTNSGTISAAAGEASGGKSAAPVIRTSSWEPTEGGHVYSVDLSTGQNEEYAAALCAKLEKAGFDAFILETNGYYRVMSGKFHDICNALNYRDCIWSNTDQTDTYIAEVDLPLAEIEAFEKEFEKNGLPGKIKDNLEKPTGPFYREGDGGVQAFSVQCSAGTSFNGAERSRDEMIAQGFDSFVYESWRIYRIQCGAFKSRADAEAYCERIHQETNRKDAYVTICYLPASMVK